ncbi:disease resistance protein RUN1-like [Lotus japonicus]|uniref:disease resistance protein RUN1-like n=1 Tax=Lotus japonicus TaxID=34305 RepID=UPI002583C821|nr:disease resistance protein RUN1-like [Lotus japonicus]
MLGSSSSSDMAPSPPKHDLFLSFRGEDTRDNFTSHLYAQLCSKNIETFIDNRLARGDEISPAPYTAIEDSMIYVIVSRNTMLFVVVVWMNLLRFWSAGRIWKGGDTGFLQGGSIKVRHQRGSYADALLSMNCDSRMK